MTSHARHNTEELVALLKDGDDQVLGELFSRFRERLWRMVNLRLNARLAARMDPDDVLQEAWIDARKRVSAWRANREKSFYIWLRLIVAQTLADVHRAHLGTKKRDAGREAGKDDPLALNSSLPAELLASLTSPSQAAMRAEAISRLEDIMAAMDPIDREILTLRHFEDLTNSEVAELLDLKPSAASNRYIRALMRIRNLFEEKTDDIAR